MNTDRNTDRIFRYWNDAVIRQQNSYYSIGFWACFPAFAFGIVLLLMAGTAVSYTLLAFVGQFLALFAIACTGFMILINHLEKKDEEREYVSGHSQF